MPHDLPDLATFERLIRASAGGNLVPMFRRLLADQITPVLAYRRLVRPDDRLAPSFLCESVVGGERIGRYSFLAAQPRAQIIAYDRLVRIIDSRSPDTPGKTREFHSDDPLAEPDRFIAGWKLVRVPGLPTFTGGWMGVAGYDTVRYLEGEKLPAPPADDRHLPDLHMGLYDQVVAFDHVQKTVLAITHVHLDEYGSIQQAYEAGQARLEELVRRIEAPPGDVKAGEPELTVGDVDLDSPPPKLPISNMGQGGYQQAVLKAKEYIKAGDIFQVVPSQRFELTTHADPFDIYRALRVVNPSPYMFYLQIQGAMLIGSSPEILCRVHEGVVTNRPLAGTRRRGRDEAEDQALEAELLADPKERAEHIMLVDLGRNDVGRVAVPGSIALPQVMTIERYSHVMHISSTVTGKLAPGRTCWDALRMALPVGTVSGAPKVRAMQIIDELEATRRGPYAGGVGYTDFAGNMDIALALRTMVVMPGRGHVNAQRTTQGVSVHRDPPWIVHLQAGGGIVADSDPDAEHQETVNKAAALAKAVALAEQAFRR
ncbi:MAG: anthranilate synthase component I [Phycisphaeraceae bacterium]